MCKYALASSAIYASAEADEYGEHIKFILIFE